MRRARISLAAAAVGLAAVASAALVTLPAAARTATDPSAAASIVGGHTAPIEDFPWMAHVRYEVATGQWICSGTVVAPRVVLTAAHCAEDAISDAVAPASTYRVLTGVALAEPTPLENLSKVFQVAVYPQYVRGLNYGDAGILILKEPVAAPAIPLVSPGQSELWDGGTPLEISGWGMTHRGLEIPARSFHVGTVLARTPRECETRTNGAFSAADQLCVTGGPRLAGVPCLGDSGGPAIARNGTGTQVEVGIFSLLGGDCEAAEASVYTRVDRVSGWVQRWIAVAEEGAPAPRLRVQEVTLPYLSLERVEEILGWGRLANQLPEEIRGFLPRHFDCTRLSKAKLDCDVNWVEAGLYFHGKVTTAFVIRGDEVAWRVRYKIRSDRRSCLRRAASTASCAVHTYTGEREAG
jgi:trypsin